MARPSGRDIRREVIEAASRAIQSRGANAFSFASIGQELGIAAPSIHHHFPRKADLSSAAVADYAGRFRQQLDDLTGHSARHRLEAYAALFLAPAQRDLMCLCGAVAADWNGIDPTTRAEVAAFFDREIGWITAQAAEAIEAGEFRPDLDPEAFATTFLAVLEGALLLARAQDDPGSVSNAATFLLAEAAHRPAETTELSARRRGRPRS